MHPLEWVGVVFLGVYGQTALKLRPQIEDRVGTFGATVVFYVLLRSLALMTGVDLLIAASVSFVLLFLLYHWLCQGTLKQEQDRHNFNEEYTRRYRQQQAFLASIYQEEENVEGTDFPHGIEDHGRRSAYRRGKHARRHDAERDGLP